MKWNYSAVSAGIALSLLIVLSGLLVSTARRTSLVYDEVIYAPVGLVYFVTGDHRLNPEHPPLQKLISAVPLFIKQVPIPENLSEASSNAWRAGYQILFGNENAADLIVSMRIPTIVLTCLFALVLYLFAARRYGFEAGLLGLVAFSFDPLVIGNGALAMNDMFVAFFFFCGWLAFYRGYFEPSYWYLSLAGIFWGLASASKFSALIFFPALGVFIVAMYFWGNDRKSFYFMFGATAMVLSLATLVLLVFYRFDAPGLWKALSIGSQIRDAKERYGFLLTEISGSGTWFYYPAAVLIKTPLALLALWILSVYSLYQKALARDRTIVWICVPVLAIGGMALAMHNHFGVRYLLPAVPLLAVLVAAGYKALSSTKERALFWALGTLLAVNAFRCTPHAMAYFNEFVGGSKNGYKWLDGSNQDWGQDLPSLAAFINGQKVKPAICMGYWGSNRPEAWGIQYQDVFSPAITNKYRMDNPNDPSVSREWLVVSASLRKNRSTREFYAWLNGREPIAFIGNTLFVYDISTDVESIQQLENIYRMMGRTALEQRQRQRLEFVRLTAESGTTSSK